MLNHFDFNYLMEEVENARKVAQEILEIGKEDSESIPDKQEYNEENYTSRSQYINYLEPVLHAANLALPGFATIDPLLIREIINVRSNLSKYINDYSLKRPHNILMIAPPGSGKSHFVKCLAKAVNKPCVISDLSAGMPYDLITFAVNEARNFKAQDEIPIIFFDEVDSNPNVIPSLLPLLWEGQFSTTGQILRVGKCVIICAASTTDFLRSQKVTNQFKNGGNLLPMKHPKLPDFLSRFNGGTLVIRSLNEERKLDRLPIVAALIRKRFKGVSAVSAGLLQFLTEIPVRYDVRSLEFLVNLIPADALKTWRFVASPQRPYGIPTRDDKLYPKFSQLFKENAFFSNALRFHISADTSTVLDLWKRLSANVHPISIYFADINNTLQV